MWLLQIGPWTSQVASRGRLGRAAMLDRRLIGPARGHLAGPGGLRRRNGGEISGPRAPQPAVPPLSSEEIELCGGSASAGGAGVITTTTSAKNANAITTDTISPGGREQMSIRFVFQ